MASRKDRAEAGDGGHVRVRYIGDGTYVIGVPATDHTVADLAEAKRLVATGLYVIDRAKPPVEEGDPE